MGQFVALPARVFFQHQHAQAPVCTESVPLQDVCNPSTRKAPRTFPGSTAQRPQCRRHPLGRRQADVYPPTAPVCAVPPLDDARPCFPAPAASCVHGRSTAAPAEAVRVQTGAGATVTGGRRETADAQTLESGHLQLCQARQNVQLHTQLRLAGRCAPAVPPNGVCEEATGQGGCGQGRVGREKGDVQGHQGETPSVLVVSQGRSHRSRVALCMLMTVRLQAGHAVHQSVFGGWMLHCRVDRITGLLNDMWGGERRRAVVPKMRFVSEVNERVVGKVLRFIPGPFRPPYLFNVSLPALSFALLCSPPLIWHSALPSVPPVELSPSPAHFTPCRPQDSPLTLPPQIIASAVSNSCAQSRARSRSTYTSTPSRGATPIYSTISCSDTCRCAH